MRAPPRNFSSNFSSNKKKPLLPVTHLFLYPQECGLGSVCPRAGAGGQESSQRNGVAGSPDPQILDLSPSQLCGLRLSFWEESWMLSRVYKWGKDGVPARGLSEVLV